MLLSTRRRELQEDYIKKQVFDEGGGFHYEYVYNNYFYEWDEPQSKLKSTRWLFGILEVISLIIFLKAAFTLVPEEANGIIAGLGMLSIIPWYFEIRGVGRFAAAKRPKKKKAFEEIQACLKIAGLVRAGMLAALVVIAFVLCSKAGTVNASLILTMVNYLVTAGISVAVALISRNLKTIAVPNIDGEPMENSASADTGITTT